MREALETYIQKLEDRCDEVLDRINNLETGGTGKGYLIQEYILLQRTVRKITGIIKKEDAKNKKIAKKKVKEA